MKSKILLALVFGMVLTVSIRGQGQGEPSERKTGDIATFTLSGSATIEMVWIEPGTFVMGSPEDEPGRSYKEGPQEEVTITQGFWLGKYEITQEQWESVMGTRPWSGKWAVREHPNHPAVHISWDDVQAFIAKLNQEEGSEVYRLPMEAEWEYACRAGTTTPWSFGDDESQSQDYGWYYENAEDAGENYAHAVGTKLPNLWGLYDMHGNVFEWVQDGYRHYTGAAQIDPIGPAGSECIMRGGSFGSYAAEEARSASRIRRSPSERMAHLGARLLRIQSSSTPVRTNTWGQIKSLVK